MKGAVAGSAPVAGPPVFVVGFAFGLAVTSVPFAIVCPALAVSEPLPASSVFVGFGLPAVFVLAAVLEDCKLYSVDPDLLLESIKQWPSSG